jgi:hypothetical protein
VPAPSSFEYAIVRIVPRVEREEFLNAGVLVCCPDRDYLAARIELDEARLVAFAPAVDLALVRAHLEAIPRICAGAANSGPIGRLPLRERWRWLVAPRSTIIQTSPAHGGVCEEPEVWIERLLESMVRVPRGG